MAKNSKCFLLFLFSFLSISLVGCTVTIDDSVPVLKVSKALPLQDTIAPMSTLKLYLSEPVEVIDSVHISIFPHFYDYYTFFNSKKDTINVVFTSFFNSPKYVLRIDDTLRSKTGLIHYPQDDSIVFYTYPEEQEPNNLLQEADTIQSIIFGTFVSGDDIDNYVICDSVKKIVFSCDQIRVLSLVVKDSTGNSVSKRLMAAKDTIVIPDTFSVPLHISARPYDRSMGSYYSIKVETN